MPMVDGAPVPGTPRKEVNMMSTEAEALWKKEAEEVAVMRATYFWKEFPPLEINKPAVTDTRARD